MIEKLRQRRRWRRRTCSRAWTGAIAIDVVLASSEVGLVARKFFPADAAARCSHSQRDFTRINCQFVGNRDVVSSRQAGRRQRFDQVQLLCLDVQSQMLLKSLWDLSQILNMSKQQ
jgi:hypothetical protein